MLPTMLCKDFSPCLDKTLPTKKETWAQKIVDEQFPILQKRFAYLKEKQYNLVAVGSTWIWTSAWDSERTVMALGRMGGVAESISTQKPCSLLPVDRTLGLSGVHSLHAKCSEEEPFPVQAFRERQLMSLQSDVWLPVALHMEQSWWPLLLFSVHYTHF